MAVTKEAGISTQALRTVIEDVESPRAIGRLNIPSSILKNTFALLDMDSTTLGKINVFTRSVAPLGIGLGLMMGALGRMASLI